MRDTIWTTQRPLGGASGETQKCRLAWVGPGSASRTARRPRITYHFFAFALGRAHGNMNGCRREPRHSWRNGWTLSLPIFVDRGGCGTGEPAALCKGLNWKDPNRAGWLGSIGV